MLVSLMIPIVSLVVYVYGVANNFDRYYAISDKYLIQKHCTDSLPIFHFRKKSYSSQFYSNGKIQSITGKQLYTRVLKESADFHVIIKLKDTTYLDSQIKQKLEVLEINQKKGIYLYKKARVANIQTY